MTLIYLNLLTESSSLLTLMSVLIPLALFVIKSFLHLICIPQIVDVLCTSIINTLWFLFLLQDRLCHQQMTSWWLFYSQLMQTVILLSFNTSIMILSIEDFEEGREKQASSLPHSDCCPDQGPNAVVELDSTGHFVTQAFDNCNQVNISVVHSHSGPPCCKPYPFDHLS
jgi:hypothetical protein